MMWCFSTTHGNRRRLLSWFKKKQNKKVLVQLTSVARENESVNRIECHDLNFIWRNRICLKRISTPDRSNRFVMEKKVMLLFAVRIDQTGQSKKIAGKGNLPNRMTRSKTFSLTQALNVWRKSRIYSFVNQNCRRTLQHCLLTWLVAQKISSSRSKCCPSVFLPLLTSLLTFDQHTYEHRTTGQFFYKMAPDAKPYFVWIRAYPEIESPRTGEGLFAGEVIEVTQVLSSSQRFCGVVSVGSSTIVTSCPS